MKPDGRYCDGANAPAKPSVLLDTRVIYCGDNLDQLRRLPEACVDLVYIDPPFNSNRNYEVFWGETKEKRSFEDRHESTRNFTKAAQESNAENPLVLRDVKLAGQYEANFQKHLAHSQPYKGR